MTDTAKDAGKPKKPAATTKAKSTAAKKTTATKATASNATPAGTDSRKKTGSKVETGRLAGAREMITLPLDAALGTANRVGGLVSPVTERVGADDRVAALRSQIEVALKRGTAVRDDARNRVAEIKGSERLKVLGERADKIQTDLTRVLESQSARAQDLIGQARGQISALRQ